MSMAQYQVNHRPSIFINFHIPSHPMPQPKWPSPAVGLWRQQVVQCEYLTADPITSCNRFNACWASVSWQRTSKKDLEKNVQYHYSLYKSTYIYVFLFCSCQFHNPSCPVDELVTQLRLKASQTFQEKWEKYGKVMKAPPSC